MMKNLAAVAGGGALAFALVGAVSPGAHDANGPTEHPHGQGDSQAPGHGLEVSD